MPHDAEPDDLDTTTGVFEPEPVRLAESVPELPVRPRDRRLLAAVAAAVVFALLSVVLVVLLVRERDQNRGDGERAAVETTASRVAEALVTVDAGGNQSGADVVRQLGTGPLIQQFDEANAAVRATFGQLKIQSISGRVQEVYVKDIDGPQADVIVVLDLVIVSDNPRVDQNHYLRVHLAKLDGQWKVDNVQDVNLALAAGVQQSTNSGTSTSTAPPATTSPPTTPATSSSSR